MRDNKWLEIELEKIWQRYFADVEQLNHVKINFGRKARTRLGSIKREEDGSTLIQINSLLKLEQIPGFIVQATIAHELTHYAHGFSSPHEQKFKHPHKGGVVISDLKSRGLEDLLVLQKKWIKNNWREFLDQNYPAGKPRRRKRKVKRIIFTFR